MTYNDLMAQLKKLGKATTVKTYRRHGIGENVFGVSFADFGKLRKKIKTDHELALQLWDSGNFDARILAAMIADPDECRVSLLERWLRDTEFHGLVDSVAGLAARSPFAIKLMEKWMKFKKEFVRQAGYSALACRLKNGLDVPDADCKRYLETIEQEIHGSTNWARYSMNNTLIAIGVFKPSLTKAAAPQPGESGRSRWTTATRPARPPTRCPTSKRP